MIYKSNQDQDQETWVCFRQRESNTDKRKCFNLERVENVHLEVNIDNQI